MTLEGSRDGVPVDIVLATYNARYTHTAAGLRWLLANLEPDPPSTALLEFYMRVPVAEAAGRILAHRPRLLALGVYIWNAERIVELIHAVKAVDPGIRMVLGGPEVSAQPDRFPAFDDVAAVIMGEGEALFAIWSRRLLNGQFPPQKVIQGPPPDLSTLKLPYSLYSDADLCHRHVYVETTRGCPFHCDFCVSGCAAGVREFPLDSTLAELCRLAERGVRTLRFVDRTFNARPERGALILNALRPWADRGLRLHLEFTPQACYRDDLQRALLAWPPGALHIELGIQSFNETVSRRVHRPGIHHADAALQFLLHTVGAEVHADLIVGLPGEDLTSIADSFDRLLGHAPHEIQVGILKNLPGTALDRHIDEWQMCFDPAPPYALQSSVSLTAEEVLRLSRFSAYWDRLANHGLLPRTLPLMLNGHVSPFAAFLHLSDWLFLGFGRTHSIDLTDLFAAIYAYLTVELRNPPDIIRAAMAADFCASGKRPERVLPKCLRANAFKVP